jgi:hypothetical protein
MRHLAMAKRDNLGPLIEKTISDLLKNSEIGKTQNIFDWNYNQKILGLEKMILKNARSRRAKKSK